MLAHTLHHPKRTLFIATCTVFSLLLITVSEGDAQLFRKYRGFSGHGGAAFSGHGGAAFGQPAAGSFWQGPSVAPQAVYSDPPVHSNAHPPIADLAPASRLPKWPFSSGNSYDPRVHLDADRFRATQNSLAASTPATSPMSACRRVTRGFVPMEYIGRLGSDLGCWWLAGIFFLKQAKLREQLLPISVISYCSVVLNR